MHNGLVSRSNWCAHPLIILDKWMLSDTWFWFFTSLWSIFVETTAFCAFSEYLPITLWWVFMPWFSRVPANPHLGGNLQDSGGFWGTSVPVLVPMPEAESPSIVKKRHAGVGAGARLPWFGQKLACGYRFLAKNQGPISNPLGPIHLWVPTHPFMNCHKSYSTIHESTHKSITQLAHALSSIWPVVKSQIWFGLGHLAELANGPVVFLFSGAFKVVTQLHSQLLHVCLGYDSTPDTGHIITSSLLTTGVLKQYSLDPKQLPPHTLVLNLESHTRAWSKSRNSTGLWWKKRVDHLYRLPMEPLSNLLWLIVTP